MFFRKKILHPTINITRKKKTKEIRRDNPLPAQTKVQQLTRGSQWVTNTNDDK